jgi:spoIIIJ-associated protein
MVVSRRKEGQPVNGAGDEARDNVITEDKATDVDVTDVEVTPQVDGIAAAGNAGSEPAAEATQPGTAAAAPPENPLDGEAEIAADYLEELLDIADLDGDIDTYIEGDRAHVSIVSDSTVLVGEGGAVLDALQELTRLAVMTETGDRSRLMLDIAGYRERRRQDLMGIAAEAIQAVKEGQARVPLAPMNPFERKVVHDAVAAAGLVSKSEGEEPKRHVVVLPA